MFPPTSLLSKILLPASNATVMSSCHCCQLPSPGEDVKLFCDDESKFSIKWCGQLRSRKLIIQADSDEHYLKLEFQKLAGTCEDNNPDADENFVDLITDISIAKEDVYTADEESQVILLEKSMEVEVIDGNKQNHELLAVLLTGI